MSTLDQAHERTDGPGAASSELMARKRTVVSAGVANAMPAFIAHAGDGFLVDVDGRRFIDFGSGIGVTTVGINNPRVAKAVAEQAANFSHTCFMITPYESYVAVCEQLAERTPGTHEKRSALFNSGSEAVENAVKVARYVTGRQAVIAFDHAYHGRTNLTMALTAKNLPYKDGFGPFAGEIYRAPLSYPFRDPNGMDGAQAAQRAISMIETQVGAGRLAAVVIEPVLGEGGVIVPAPGFLPALSAWCKANGVLLIADEVQSGIARTGNWFACEYEDIVPDLITTAKGIAGGLPLSGLTGRAEIMDAIHPGGLGGTYGGNPIACAASLAVFETIVEDRLIERAREIEVLIKSRLLQLQKRDLRIGDIRGRGAMIGAEFVKPGTVEPDGALTRNVAAFAQQNGLIALTCGTYGNVIRFLPPLTITDELLNEGLDVITAGLEASR